VSPEKQALAVFWNHKRFLFAQTLFAALWAALVVGWFWLPDSKTWGVIVSAVGAFPAIAGAVWWVAAAFVFYRRAHTGGDLHLWAVYSQALRRSPALFVWALLLAAAIWLALRPPAIPWIWIGVLLLLAPYAVYVTADGPGILFRPSSYRILCRPRYYAQFAALSMAGILLPYALIAWHPPVHGLALQTVSLAVRFLVAYELAIIAWLILASLLAAFPAPSTPEP
jgi:hypothetical protein